MPQFPWAWWGQILLAWAGGKKKGTFGKDKAGGAQGKKKREHLGKMGKAKLVMLRCRCFYQLQKPAATVNHRGGGGEEELVLECER